MKIARLDLLAFGPFTDVSLDLDAGSGLQLIYGPNEAGKSSTLRAITQLLYGIPHNSADNFVHPYGKLRIGAVLQEGDTRLECVRRKGNRNTLLAADETEVVEDQLQRLLHGVDAEGFRVRFGIDYEQLVRGGRALAEGHGELGQSLFAAASGLAHLGRVQRALVEEAEQLFKPKGSKPRINAAVSQWKAKQKELRLLSLASAEWEEHDRRLRDAQRRRQEIEQQYHSAAGRQKRLERLRQAVPLAARRAELLEALRPLARVARLSEGFSETRRTAQSDVTTQRRLAADCEQKQAELQRLLSELSVDERLLARQQEVQELYLLLGEHRKAMRDRPELVEQRRRAEQLASGIWKAELGWSGEAADAERLRVRPDQQTRIQELANQQQGLQARLDNDASQLETLRQQIAGTERQLDECPPAQDAAELRRALRRVQQDGNLDRTIQQTRQDLEAAEQQARVDLQRLGLWTGTLEQLETLPLPSAESVEHHDQVLNAAQGMLETQKNRRQELLAQLAEKQEQLEQLSLEQDVPSEDELRAARRRRDEGWQLVRQAWQGGIEPAEAARRFVAECSPAAELGEAYQMSVVEADRVADRLRAEAERVAVKARLRAECQKLEQQHEGLNEAVKQAEEQQDQARRQWIQLWEPAGIQPLSPREMRAWLNAGKALLAAAESIRRLQNDVLQLQSTRDRHVADLHRCLEEVELEQMQLPRESSLSETVELCESVIARLDHALQRRQQLQDKLAQLRQQVPTCNEQLATAERRWQQWQQQWGEAVSVLQLPPDAAPAQANQVLAALQRLAQNIAEARQLAERIEGIDRDADAFRAAVERLVAELAPTLSDVAHSEAAARLHQQLQDAIKGQERCEQLQRQLHDVTAARVTAEQAARKAQSTLETLCQEAGCHAVEQLAEVEQQHATRRQLERDLGQLDERLRELALGTELAEFVDEVRSLDAGHLEIELAGLNTQLQALQNEKDELLEVIGQESNELKRMDGHNHAAEAAVELQHLLANVRNDAEQYVRLRLAAAVLRHSVERYRDKNQQPLLQRASELFRDLTLGSFIALRAETAGEDQAVLVGVRPDGKTTVSVDGMSEGACDQLYLALRLAGVEHYLAHNPPIPFVVDDILIKFDDARSIAALQALGELARKTQVIFFTHHAHLLELARKHLDADQLTIHHLDGQQDDADTFDDEHLVAARHGAA